MLAASGLTGYLSSVRNLTAPADQWIAGGVPLVSMMNMERRHGSDKPVIKKALVELDGAPFKDFASKRGTGPRARTTGSRAASSTSGPPS